MITVSTGTKVYPRVCGGTGDSPRGVHDKRGLSPRVRGNPNRRPTLSETRRSIPACAGEPPDRRSSAGRAQVYPRVCGGTKPSPEDVIREQGLSPRVRGNLVAWISASCSRGSIPACAGEPRSSMATSPGWQVYPRVCGGTHVNRAGFHICQGLSPRVRGNLCYGLPCLAYKGSIPACAGEPKTKGGASWTAGVYPRVCGGTMCLYGNLQANQGLSPRVRGNRDRLAGEKVGAGSIPACAGEPPSQRPPTGAPQVYPRVCGGTHPAVKVIFAKSGLSPRVRGNLFALRWWAGHGRSIPACAGEPGGRTPCAHVAGVYPRVCGGTAREFVGLWCGEGLSPRVRGNLAEGDRSPLQTGSIPACAGEPANQQGNKTTIEVYPRVCGGTDPPYVVPLGDEGLSPRVRGNLDLLHFPIAHRRSIPACAGEPAATTMSGRVWRVYPRVCGGTMAGSPNWSIYGGLSPRVRGNRNIVGRRTGKAGSIPACAGEPAGTEYECTNLGVYPRVCGGTLLAGPRLHQLGGLSPRVRGNLGLADLLLLMGGSIPACAGEPSPPPSNPTEPMVYPRVCGGTAGGGFAARNLQGLSPRVRGNQA